MVRVVPVGEAFWDQDAQRVLQDLLDLVAEVVEAHEETSAQPQAKVENPAPGGPDEEKIQVVEPAGTIQSGSTAPCCVSDRPCRLGVGTSRLGWR